MSFVSFVVKAVAVSDVSIKLDLDSAGGENIRRAFARLADPSEVLADFGEYKRRRIVLSMPRMPRLQRSSPGVPPARRTGLLSQRITWAVAGPRLDVGTNDERAAMLHFGGTIRPRTAKALAVPIHPDAQGKRPRDFADLDFIPRKGSGRPPLLVRKVFRGKSDTLRKMDVMFVLLKSVKLPARPFLVWNPEDETYLGKSLQKALDQTGAQARRGASK